MHSPAKINLGLRVHHRREDGYHYLTSLFLPISFGDTISFEAAEQNLLTTENLLPAHSRRDFAAISETGDASKNLILRALQALNLPKPLHVHLEKRIPLGGGLGGGSSNAGAVLRYARDEFGIEVERLFAIALSLGADVPFFLRNRPMLVYGIGDLMEEIEVGPGFGLLSLPPISVSTPHAYAELKRSLQSDPPPKSLQLPLEDLKGILRRSDWKELTLLENDFEGPVFRMYPELSAIKRAFIEAGALYASMSGSGATVYGLVANQTDQEDLASHLGKRFPDLSFVPFQF